jgi:hypothetical protein
MVSGEKPEHSIEVKNSPSPIGVRCVSGAVTTDTLNLLSKFQNEKF